MEIEPVAMLRSNDVVITGQSVKNVKVDEVSHKKIVTKVPPLFFDGKTKSKYLAVLVRSWSRLAKHRQRVVEAAKTNRERVAVLYARDILSIHKGSLLNSIVITARIGTSRGSSGNIEMQVKEGSLKFLSFKDALRWRATLLRLSASEDNKDDSCLIMIPPDLATSNNLDVSITDSGAQLTYVVFVENQVSNAKSIMTPTLEHRYAQQIGYWLGTDNSPSTTEYDDEDTSSSDEGHSKLLQNVLKSKKRKSRKKLDDWTSSTSFSSADFNTYARTVRSVIYSTAPTLQHQHSNTNTPTPTPSNQHRYDASQTNPHELVCINVLHFSVS